MDYIKQYALNKDTTKQYSLTLHPNLLPPHLNGKSPPGSPRKALLRARMVCIQVLECDNEEDELSKSTQMKLDNLPMSPPHCIIYPPATFQQGSIKGYQWQVSLNSLDPIKSITLPRCGFVRVILQNHHYIGPFRSTQIVQMDEEFVLLVPIEDQSDRTPHPLFSHIRFILDEQMNIIKIFMVGNIFEEETQDANDKSIGHAEELLENSTISAKRLKPMSDEDDYEDEEISKRARVL